MRFSEWVQLREAKDACYHKVKSRYSVWPSAYASGALVKCRKVGAKNWGKSKKKKKKKINESLKDRGQYDDAASAVMALYYSGIDASKESVEGIIQGLKKIKRHPPEGVGIEIFAARIKSVSLGTTTPEDFKEEKTLDEGSFDLENKKGLHGWFSRKTGGWIDCKTSRKGNLVPCGRKTAGKGAERSYPACRPTLSMCNKSKNKKKSSKRISWE